MRIILIALFLLPLSETASQGQTGDAQAGKALWQAAPASGAAAWCRNCHGAEGKGGFGPDLAGRGLTLAQFRQAIRKPWGIMPAYTEQQLSDAEIANLHAYFASLPSVAEPQPRQVNVRPGAPHAEQLVNGTIGCGQCHNPSWAGPRGHAGAVGGDFAWFSRMVYEHATFMPQHRPFVGEDPGPVRMGTYSRERLPEPVLRDIWDWIADMGFRPRIIARLSRGVAGGNGRTHTVTVENFGVREKGLSAEDVTIALTVPAGLTVTNAGGADMRRDAETGANVVTWKVARITPQDKKTYTITISGQPTDAGQNVRGVVRWARPTEKDASGRPTGGEANIAPPPRT